MSHKEWRQRPQEIAVSSAERLEQFVLGVDLDGVVADFAGGLRPIAAEWLGVAPESLTPEVSYGFAEWGLDTAGGYDALHRFAVKERELFARLPAMPGAPSALRRLDTIKELRIRIVTHRLYIHWFHKEAIRQTTEWLERHGIPYWDLCFMRDKAAVGANLYLEDSPENIAALRSTGHETIVVVNSTNRHLPGPRASNWVEIEELVSDPVAAWRRG
jgi:5'(3')-deoxyribonucleotidase